MMKILLQKINTTTLTVVWALILASILIWFGAPQWSPLLAASDKRMYIIALIFLIWALIHLLYQRKTQPAVENKAPPTEIAKKLMQLQGRFLGALAFLKKTTIQKSGKDISLAQLPWYLLIGPSQAGKTSLLANAHIHFILSKQFKSDTHALPASDACDWWITRDMVLVDIPGSYLATKSSSAKLWSHLMELLKQHRPKNTLGGIVLTLNLPELLKQSSHAQLIHDLKNRVKELKNNFGHQLPIYLVITKCDLMPGFIEFFGDAANDELGQAWGITLPMLKANDKSATVFAHRFNALIKRLNKQLIARLHQERNPAARPLIKDFPLQIERLKESIVNFLKLIDTLQIPLHLYGVYLTSAVQPTPADDSILHDRPQFLQIIDPPQTISRAYFIKQLLLQGLTFHTEPAHAPIAPTKRWPRRLAYTASVGTVLTAAIFLGNDFQRSVQQAYSIQSDLTQYQLYLQQPLNQRERLSKMLPLLDKLQQAASSHSNQLASLLAFYSNKSHQTAKMIYQQALQSIVLPEIKNTLEEYLQKPEEKNIDQLYAVLKAYVMLGDAEHMQPKFVAQTVLSLHDNVNNPHALMNHMMIALTHDWKPSTLKTDRIDNARKIFNALTTPELAMVILKNEADNLSPSVIHAATYADVFTSKSTTAIPLMFTIERAEKILAKQIPDAALEAAQGNWIVGATPAAASPNSIADHLRALYFAQYIAQWENFTNQLHIVPTQNLAEMHKVLSTLTSDTSPLLQALRTIQDNTNLAPLLAQSTTLRAIHDLFNPTSAAMLNKTLADLKQLQLHLQTQLSTQDSEKSIWQETAKRMKNPAAQNDALTTLYSTAEQSPAPLKQWLTELAAQTWRLQLTTTAHYLQSIWQTTVYSPYDTQLSDRYPFAANDTPFDPIHFTSIFGGKGTLAYFYRELLTPFIVQNDKEWRWQIINGEKLPFAPETLTELQQALRVQHLFFPKGDDQMISLPPRGVANHTQRNKLQKLELPETL